MRGPLVETGEEWHALLLPAYAGVVFLFHLRQYSGIQFWPTPGAPELRAETCSDGCGDDTPLVRAAKIALYWPPCPAATP